MMFISPIYTASGIIAAQKPFKLNQLDTKQFMVQNTSLPDWEFAQTDITNLVTKVAEQNNVTMQNFIDSEKLIKFDNKGAMLSEIHPNEHGYGLLAQELYMRLAFSPKIKQMITDKYESYIDLHEWQSHVATENNLKKSNLLFAQKNKKLLL